MAGAGKHSPTLKARVEALRALGMTWREVAAALAAEGVGALSYETLRKRYGVPRKKLGLADMQALAASRDGECLSENYLGARQRLLWRCALGHEWSNTGGALRNTGSWCPTCNPGGRAPLDIDWFKANAKRLGGSCLAESYEGIFEPLDHVCALGHAFVLTGNAIKNEGRWCPVCEAKPDMPKSRFHRRLAHIAAFANSQGGKCHSTRLSELSAMVLLETADGELFVCPANKVKSDQRWLPKPPGRGKGRRKREAGASRKLGAP